MVRCFFPHLGFFLPEKTEKWRDPVLLLDFRRYSMENDRMHNGSRGEKWILF